MITFKTWGLQMTLRNLIKRMDKAYYNEGILIEKFDFPRHDIGDGLASFIINETKEVVDTSKKYMSKKDIAEIWRAINKAKVELERVLESLPA